jgi:hypothetical protein
MLIPYFSNPMAHYALGFQSFETDSLYALCEQIDYKMQCHMPEQSHLAEIILKLEKHIHDLRNLSELNEIDIDDFASYIYFEWRCLKRIINPINDFSPELNIFRVEFKLFLEEKGPENKVIPITKDRLYVFINRLNRKFKEEKFSKGKNNLRTRVEKNRKSLSKYTESLQYDYPNLEIIRFEIALCPKNEDKMEDFIKRYIKDKNDFLYFLTKREFKKNIIGYMWKFQPQQDDGYVSCHIVLFLKNDEMEKGNKKQDIDYKMKILKSRWRELTDGYGKFWDCYSFLKYRCNSVISSEKSNYEIEYELKIIVNYFVNTDYFFRLKLEKKYRSYGRGEIS